MADLTYFHGVEILEGGSTNAVSTPPSGGGEVDPPTPSEPSTAGAPIGLLLALTRAE